MTEFKVGDAVRLTKGEPDKPGYRVEVRTVTDGISKSPEVNGYTLRTFENAGWTVELISRPLPTKPNTLGWATVGGGRGIVRRNDVGTWSVYDEIGFTFVVPDEDLSDFTEAVLIPKTLADKVTAWSGDEDAVSIMQQIADHLKGQDDE